MSDDMNLLDELGSMLHPADIVAFTDEDLGEGLSANLSTTGLRITQDSGNTVIIGEDGIYINGTLIMGGR